MSQYLTAEGLEKFKMELHELKTVKRQDVIIRIRIAREQGDLSENAEYADAKDEQGFIEGRILELESIINRAIIIGSSPEQVSDTVDVGATVVVDCGGRSLTYTIVGSNEANPAGGLISNESPMGRAFLGKRVGERIVVAVPKGDMECTIVEIKATA